MAVKNSLKKEFNVNYNVIMEILRTPKFATLIEAELVEEAKTENHIEFRYARKTTLTSYGRNYFVTVPQIDGETTTVTITTQSKKKTVLVDIVWLSEAKRVSSVIEALIS